MTSVNRISEGGTSLDLGKLGDSASALSLSLSGSTLGPGPLPKGLDSQKYRSTTGCNDTPADVISAIKSDLCELDDTMSETSPFVWVSLLYLIVTPLRSALTKTTPPETDSCQVLSATGTTCGRV